METRYTRALLVAPALLWSAALTACGSGPPSGATGDAGDAGGLIWVARQGTGLFGPDTLIAIDPSSAEISRRVGTEDVWANLAIGAGGLWSAGSAADLVVRIDPRSGAADSIALPEGSHPDNVVLAEGSLWVASGGNGKVLRIDPERREVTATIDVTEDRSIDDAIRLAAGEGAIWAISLFGRYGLLRIDPATNTVTGRIEDVGDGAVAVAAGAGAIWVASVHDGMVQRVDPSTLSVVASIPVGSRPVSVAVGAGAVWVGKQSDGTVDRIDPQTNRVVATFPIGGEPGQLIVANDAVWVLNHADQTLARIDPAADEVTAIVELGNRPLALIAAP